MTEPLNIQNRLEELRRESGLICPNCRTVLYRFVDLRPDLTAAEFVALNIQLGKGPHCLHARVWGKLTHFPNVALDSFPDEYRDDILYGELP
jgi:hypothetical protein